jgi:chitin disaccharide deacetylase
VDTPQPAERRLIINADDFGLTVGVNRAILELNTANVLPSATLMATGAAFRDAVHSAFRQTTLGVGCHVVLVDGQSELHPSEIPSLAPEGHLRSSLSSFMVDLFGGRIDSREMEREAVAQIRKVQSAGLTVTHIDTHKHAHMFPRVLGSIIRAARDCGVPAIRNPFEPDWSIRLTNNAPSTRRLQVRTLRLFRERFLRVAHAAKLRTTDGTLGVLATGTFDADYVLRLLRNMPLGSWELVCHPGYVDSTLRRAGTRLIETREAERQALLTVLVDPPPHLPRIDLMHYGEFTA